MELRKPVVHERLMPGSPFHQCLVKVGVSGVLERRVVGPCWEKLKPKGPKGREVCSPYTYHLSAIRRQRVGGPVDLDGVTSHGGEPLRFHLTDLSVGGDGERLVIYCQTTGVSAAHATHCASYCTPCRPLRRAFSGWIRTPPPTLFSWRRWSGSGNPLVGRNSTRDLIMRSAAPNTPVVLSSWTQ